MVCSTVSLFPVVFDLPHNTQYAPENTSKYFSGCPKNTGTPQHILNALICPYQDYIPTKYTGYL